MEHTKTPWKVNNVFIENAENQYFVSEDKWGGANIACCGSSVSGDWDINEANAAYIVKCCNNFEAMEFRLNIALAALTNPQSFDLDQVREDTRAILQRIERGA